MKWFKQNWMVALFLVLIVISLPLGWFFSTGMNKKIKTDQESAATADMRTLTGSSVTYQLPAINPGEEGLTVSTVPNDRITEWFTAERQRIAEQLGEVKTKAGAYNRREHSVIIDGIFPEPGSRRQGQLLAVEMVKALVGEDGAPSAYNALLASVGAGKPLGTDMLAETLNDLDQRERQRIRAETGAEALSEEEAEQIRTTLIKRRLREYRRRARELSFYADDSVFFQGAAGARPPIAVPAQPPEIDECFVWQFDYWVYADILDAINLANAADARPLGIEDAPVKRVISINVDPLLAGDIGGGPAAPPPDRGGRGGRGGYGDPGDYGDPSGMDDTSADVSAVPGGEVPRDYALSITGRVSGPANQTYDVRNVRLQAIVASQKLPTLIDALAQTNFMTVTGIAVQKVDAWDKLQEGYYYGPDNVVKVTLDIETIWLREWTVPLMPDPIVSALGVIKPQPEESIDGDG